MGGGWVGGIGCSGIANVATLMFGSAVQACLFICLFLLSLLIFALHHFDFYVFIYPSSFNAWILSLLCSQLVLYIFSIAIFISPLDATSGISPLFLLFPPFHFSRSPTFTLPPIIVPLLFHSSFPSHYTLSFPSALSPASLFSLFHPPLISLPFSLIPIPIPQSAVSSPFPLFSISTSSSSSHFPLPALLPLLPPSALSSSLPLAPRLTPPHPPHLRG